MRSVLALIRKDLKGYFDQPTGYILLVIFVGVISYLFFYVTQFNTARETSLRDLFTLLPWMLGVFVPASTMRLLAEEQRDGTLEILLTQPIRGWVVLLTKYVSGLIFVGLMIVATLGIPIAISTAGNLDWGAVAAQYVGSMFLAAAFVSVGLFTSSLTRNQIVAFIVGLFINVGLMIIGLDAVALTLPSRVATLLEALSPVTHFSSIARGVITLRDILYFIALVSTFLSATFLMVRGRTLSHAVPQYRNLQLGVAGLIVFSLLVGWFGNDIGGRLDLTEEKVFTLTDGTSDIVSSLDDLLVVEIFQSQDPPVELGLVSRDVKDFLDDFEASSDGNVKIVNRYPGDPNSEDTRRAEHFGIQAQQFNTRTQGEFQVKTGYLGISMTYLNRREVVPAIRTMDGFEYRLATQVYSMVQEEVNRRSVAFLTGSGQTSPSNGMSFFANVLSQQYDVFEIDASEGNAPDFSGIDVLVIAGSNQVVSAEVRQGIDAYIRGGGKAMMLVDPILVDQSSLQTAPNQHSMADFLEGYGVIVEDNLVFDIRSSQTVPFGSVLLPYYYWIRVPTVDSKVAGDAQEALMPWTSSLGFVPDSAGGAEFIPLLATTNFGGVDYELGSVGPNAPQIQVGNLTPEQLFNVDVGFALEGPARADGEPYRLVVMGDSQWLSDGYIQTIESLNYPGQNNLFLGLNLVDWLSQEQVLADIRSKVVSSRPLLYEPGIHQNAVQYGNIAGIPLILIAIGAIRFARRRSASSRTYGREK
jgi:ABC-2 type transport system permease protein